MSSAPAYTPALSPIGTVEIKSANTGNAMFSVFYEPALTELGSVLMFEYKLTRNTNDVVLGFIGIENATNSGISNQWQISIPSPGLSADAQFPPLDTTKIQVRVYIGNLTSSDISATSWSNMIDLHPSPRMPVIYKALYDVNNVDPNKDDLYAILQKDSKLDYNAVKFVAAYYYKSNDTAETVWGVSNPVSAIPESFGGTEYMVTKFPQFGELPQTGNISVSTAVYTVYEYQYDGSNYYSVSHISETVAATPASLNTTPIVTGISYDVYSQNRMQTIKLQWSPPPTIILPFTSVTGYRLEMQVNDDEWVQKASVGSDAWYHEFDVSSYGCGDEFKFRVIAVFTGDVLSDPSPDNDYSHLNYFKFASKVNNLTIADTIFNDGKVSMKVKFDAPDTICCGRDRKFECVVVDSQGRVSTDYTDYHHNSTNYTITFSDMTMNQTGSVSVLMSSIDTNYDPMFGPGPYHHIRQNGPLVQIPFYASNLELDEVAYDIYDTGVQNMTLNWNNLNSPSSPWTAKYYVFLNNVNLTSVPIHNTTYNYDSSNHSCGDVLTFQVKAELTHTSGTIYRAPSNTVSIKFFKHATVPRNAFVKSALVSVNLQQMDLSLIFNNPENNGCGAVKDIVVKIYDVSENLLAERVLTYAPNTGPYIGEYNVRFDDVSLVDIITTGRAVIYMRNTDTNSNGIIDGNYTTLYWAATEVPIIQALQIDNDRTLLSFKALTRNIMDQIAVIGYSDNTGNMTTKKWKTTYNNERGPNNGYTNDGHTNITHTVEPVTGVLNYIIEIKPTLLDPGFTTFPNSLFIAMSNNAGVTVSGIPDFPETDG